MFVVSSAAAALGWKAIYDTARERAGSDGGEARRTWPPQDCYLAAEPPGASGDQALRRREALKPTSARPTSASEAGSGTVKLEVPRRP